MSQLQECSRVRHKLAQKHVDPNTARHVRSWLLPGGPHLLCFASLGLRASVHDRRAGKLCHQRAGSSSSSSKDAVPGWSYCTAGRRGLPTHHPGQGFLLADVYRPCMTAPEHSWKRTAGGSLSPTSHQTNSRFEDIFPSDNREGVRCLGATGWRAGA